MAAAAAAAVAKVALHSSRSIVNVTPAASSPASPFSASLTAKSADASVHDVAFHNEPAAELINLSKAAASGVVSLLASADTSLLTRFVPHLPALVNTASVIHIATSGDHADVLALRSSGLIILHSSTATEAHDHALLAVRIAATTKRAVLHYFETVDGDNDAVQDEVTEADLKSFVASSSSSATSPSTAPNGVNGVNGVNGSNGYAASNGNGVANGNGASHVKAPASTGDLDADLSAAYDAVSDLVGREVKPFALYGSSQASDVAVVLGPGAEALSKADSSLAVIDVRLVRPSLATSLLSVIPTSAKRLITLERSARRTTRIGPLFVDVATALQSDDSRSIPATFVSGSLGHITSSNASDAAKTVSNALSSQKAGHGVLIGDTVKKTAAPAPATTAPVTPPKHEEAYSIMLDQVFKERLAVINSPHDETDPHPAARSPEYAFGQVMGQLEQRDALERAVKSAVRTGGVSPELHDILSQWLVSKDDSTKSAALSAKFSTLLSSASSSPDIDSIKSLVSHADNKSRWIVGSDAWAYDAGMGGVHHVLASGRNVNMLIFDTLPYSKRDSIDASKRKKDIGLYAMSYGGAYVASTAVYADYTQVLHALLEADKFDGPSVVLAYVPYRTVDAAAIEVLKETKLAVDSGYWPLYRWDPSAESKGKEVFRLDSTRVREQLREFLDRQNHLSFLANARPELSYDLASSQGTALRERQKSKAKEAYEKMLDNLDGPPLLILFASDGGNAEKQAKKLSARAKARGIAARLLAMDDFPVAEELKDEENVIFLTSTAGQGEAPQNGRLTWKALQAMESGSLSGVKYSVFGMGDSHYWPRPEDAHYYNKPGKDFDLRLEKLGAERVADLGLGDDQDPDGPQTGYKVWEPLVWKAMGVDAIEVKEAEPEPINNEHMKIASNYLRGTIVEGLADKSTGAIAETDQQLTKFHGTYMQYDRDTLDERKAAGLEPAYSFMIRCRIPGGVCTPKQWMQLDDVAEQYGNKTMKITTRQTIQYHCVVKGNLKSAMQGINKACLDTIAACGDVNRNVMCSPNPAISQLHDDVYEFSKSISEYLLPRMNAYHEIWLDKGTDSKNQLLAGGALKDYEPLYGPYYLPRKFKIAIAVPPRNDTDCFAHDIGLIAIAGKDKKLKGFNLSVGGGMGVTHSMKVTYPRAGSVIGFVTCEQTLEACKQVMLIQRDTGNRANRKQARLKYTIDNYWKGPENFRKELERRLGYQLAEPESYKFTTNTDEYGWKKDHRGNWHCTLWLENGRVKDVPGEEFRKGLYELCRRMDAEEWGSKLRMTPNQHIIVADVPADRKQALEEHLRAWNMDQYERLTGVFKSASACVAFPTCGLAMAESERMLGGFAGRVEKLFARWNLQETEVTTRVSGCANGCSRSWLGEIGLVGKAPGTYLLLLGGAHDGSRPSKPYAESVTEDEIIKLLEPVVESYAKHKEEGEPFGDYVTRVGIIRATTEGKRFYEDSLSNGVPEWRNALPVGVDTLPKGKISLPAVATSA
ncbi:putative sulfite reductase cys-4 [Jaminaea rosea]|uniref:Sulfite reductase [NADPH] subunit beta n=1 Tax=Jaminaea rosea TaxID=1569628 RepID=A0A316UYK3_9BASI|nr:putative sulfite reductase cys-4 [Jaminaea rosea]PWN28983.1 putative sulfite reductase cys-4 [Jaminaea rosea]